MNGPHLITVEPHRVMEKTLWRLRRYIRYTAFSVAGDRFDLVDDLIQEGMIGVWNANPWRLDLNNAHDRRYALRRIKRRIWAERKRELQRHRPATLEKLAERVRGQHWVIGSSTIGLNGVVRRHAGAE